jgi:hypothetical protein
VTGKNDVSPSCPPDKAWYEPEAVRGTLLEFKELGELDAAVKPDGAAAGAGISIGLE